MSKPNVGKILDHDKSYTRDAIHVPIAPAIAGELLYSGNSVYYKNGYAYKEPREYLDKDTIGIVDPFLPGLVEQGSKFYIFLKPGSVTKLWHDWVHPKIDKKQC